MARNTYTIGELASALTGGNERAVRKALVDVGVELDEYSNDLSETVTGLAVIDIAANRARDIVGRRAMQLLSATR